MTQLHATDHQTIIQPGARVTVRTALDDRALCRALTGVIRGKDFPVVYVCREENWLAASAEGRQPDGTPCPAQDVELT